ncbi:MAG: hypothetical protein NTX25_16695 [Proteobacteria bacterium]|nr:hypothetical protein [Pseudomonadota bacterium]
MDNFEVFRRLRSSKALVVEAFYRSLDSSLIRSSLDKGLFMKEWTKLGEGRHFQSFRLPVSGGLSLAINLAKSAFYGSEPVLRKHWKDDLKYLFSLDHPLVPPMEFLIEPQYFVYIQPYCETMLAQSPETKILLQDLETRLQGLGLLLDDFPQLRLCQGHPFLIDYSELKRMKSAGIKF